jgi:hypothetical protein
MFDPPGDHVLGEDFVLEDITEWEVVFDGEQEEDFTPADAPRDDAPPPPPAPKKAVGIKPRNWNTWTDRLRVVIHDVDNETECIGLLTYTENSDEVLGEAKGRLKDTLNEIADKLEEQDDKKNVVIKKKKGFECTDQKWKKSQQWKVDQLYFVMDQLLSNYDVDVKPTNKKDLKLARAIGCAKKLCLCPDNIATKADLEQSVKAWLSPFQVSSFFDRMHWLETFIGKFTNNKPQSRINMAKVQIVLQHRTKLSKAEKGAVCFMFITIADY